jgi:predicted enzyme related to lactoylglutathione lyase
MTRRATPWPFGVPCWVDLGGTDVEGAMRLYGAVLGWEFEQQGEGYGGYVMCRIGGRDAAGIGLAQEGVPPAWTVYFATDDADATAKAVVDAGGRLLAEPFDVVTLGRMFVATDPGGAAFGVWQAIDSIGATHVNEPGGLTWEDLSVPDPDAAREFYAAVFGFVYDELPDAPSGYQLFRRPDEPWPLGGMGGLAEGAYPSWLPYFSVHDTDAAVAATQDNGGSVVQPAHDSEFGRQAVLADADGAVFSVIQAIPDAPQPDR